MPDATTVLIVDDNFDDRETYSRLLKRQAQHTYRLFEAENGEEAIRLCREHNPDCILLDYSLPGRDGIAILEEIRANNMFAAVIMLTGQGNEKIAVEVMKAGAQDYLVKGTISADTLQRGIANAITQQRLAAKLEQQRQSLEIFTRAMAHDLKEPLRTIKSFGRIVHGSEDLPSASRDLMDFVLKAADNMESLINSISRYTRLEAYNTVVREVVSFADVLDETKSNLRQQIESRKARIINEGLGSIEGDEALLTQLLQNLISNAINYCTSATPEIRVRTEYKPGFCQLFVADNGPGIAAEFHETIFKPFKRLVGREKEGSGLGLAICRKIVELHGGTIHCDSAAGEGAVFIATFPSSETIATTQGSQNFGEAPPASYGSVDPVQMRMADVLLVEDSPADVHLTRLKLMDMEHVRFNLHVTTNGKEAMAWLESRIAQLGSPGIDLMLLDINMPIMDGFQVLESLSADRRLVDIPVCMLSTSSDEIDLQRARARGAKAYMVKPASCAQLKDALKSITSLHLLEDNGGYRLSA
jgi:signal transduction histidine kinase